MPQPSHLAPPPLAGDPGSSFHPHLVDALDVHLDSSRRNCLLSSTPSKCVDRHAKRYGGDGRLPARRECESGYETADGSVASRSQAPSFNPVLALEQAPPCLVHLLGICGQPLCGFATGERMVMTTNDRRTNSRHG